jgi:hypothetical protein
MTQISMTDSQSEGIRELTNEEIAAVAGGSINNSGPLSCIIHQVQTIICKVERLLSCFGNQNNGS